MDESNGEITALNRLRQLLGKASFSNGADKYSALECVTMLECMAPEVKQKILEKDAQRYRKLRRGQHWSIIDGAGRSLRAEDLDAAIDSWLL